MTKKVYTQSIIKWLIGIGATGGTLIGGIFMYLMAVGAISNVSYSPDSMCAGTVTDPCYAYINFTAEEDIFIYPTNYDPYGRDTIFNFDPNVKSWKLERSWGSGWREIPMNTSCTGTWCGAPDNTGKTTYAVAFRKGKTYQIRLTAYKNKPYENIKWGAFSGVDEIDPIWYGVEKNKININTVFTPTSETTCNGIICTKIYYSEIKYVLEDSKWKNVEEARSLKGSGIDCMVISDGENIAECIDWNYTTVTLRIGKSKNFAKESPIRIIGVDGEKSRVDYKFNSVSDKKQIIVPLSKSEVVHFGENSSFIYRGNQNVVQDTYVDEANPNTNYGDGAVFYVLNSTTASTRREIYMRFDNVTLPENTYHFPGSEIRMWVWQNNLDAGETQNVGVYYLANQSWNESLITWNNKGSLGNFYGPVAYKTYDSSSTSLNLLDNYISFYNTTGNTSILNNFSGNLSFYIRTDSYSGSPSSLDSMGFYSSEGTNVAYLQLRYISGNGFCWQESANISNQKGTDGNCGQVYNGSYSFTGTWNDTSKMIDGDWETSTDINASSTISINYTKPNNANISGAYAISSNYFSPYTYASSSAIASVQIPSECVIGYQLQLKYAKDWSSNYDSLYCWSYKNNNWLSLDDSEFFSMSTFREESILWNTNKDNEAPFMNITTPSNSSIFTNTNYVTFDHETWDNTGIWSCWYSMDGGINTTVSCNGSVSRYFLNGTHTVRVYSNDSWGNLAYDDVTFTIGRNDTFLIVDGTINKAKTSTITTPAMGVLGATRTDYTPAQYATLEFSGTANGWAAGTVETSSNWRELFYNFSVSNIEDIDTINASWRGASPTTDVNNSVPQFGFYIWNFTANSWKVINQTYSETLNMSQYSPLTFWNLIDDPQNFVQNGRFYMGVIGDYIWQETSGSCAFIYSYDGKKYNLEGHLADMAVHKDMEYTTHNMLNKLVKQGDYYKIGLREVIPETQYIDDLELLKIKSNTEIVSNQFKDEFYTIQEKKSPLYALDENYRLKNSKIKNDDGEYWVGDLNKIDIDNPPMWNVLQMKFWEFRFWDKLKCKIFGKCQTEEFTLVIDGKQTGHLHYQWGTMMTAIEGANKTAYDIMNNNEIIKNNVLSWAENNSLLYIYQKIDGEWQLVDYIGYGNSFVDHTYGVRLNHTKGDNVDIRIVGGVYAYEIDQVYIDTKPQRNIEIEVLRPEFGNETNMNNLNNGKLLSQDKDYMTMDFGDYVNVNFYDPDPQEENDRFLLRSNAYSESYTFNKRKHDIDFYKKAISQEGYERKTLLREFLESPYFNVTYPTERDYLHDTLYEYYPTLLITYTAEEEPPANDTCTYTSGNWNIDCADNCVISSPVNLGGNTITFTGSGTVTLNERVTGYNKFAIFPSCKIVNFNKLM